MNTLTHTLIVALLACTTHAADTPSVLSAQDIAARLSERLQDGNTYVRLQMEVKQANGTAASKVQLQIKSRHTATATDVVYQVLWPKERKGEAVLLRKSGASSASGALLSTDGQSRTLDAAQWKQPLLDSDLSYEDLVENAYAWERQAITGTEIVSGVSCQILESKPGKGARSSYGSVRTWVDPRRMVQLRVEKYSSSGALVRRIDTTRVSTDDAGHHIPANLLIRRAGQNTSTEMEGSRLKRGVTYADREFTADGLKDLNAPRSAAE